MNRESIALAASTVVRHHPLPSLRRLGLREPTTREGTISKIQGGIRLRSVSRGRGLPRIGTYGPIRLFMVRLL